MEKHRFQQTGVVEADILPSQKYNRGQALASHTQHTSIFMIGAVVSLLTLIATIALMISNWLLYIQSMSLLLQVLVWAIALGLPGMAIFYCVKQVARGVMWGWNEVEQRLDQRAERKRQDALALAAVNLKNAEAAEAQARAMQTMRTIPFDQYANAAVIGVHPSQIVQLAGQFAQPAPKMITNNNNAGLLNAGQEQQEQIERVVPYAEIANQVPSELSLLGIHPANGNLEIVSPDNYKTTWFVGGSNTGKTNTVYGKVADAVRWQARLIICDNHAHKNDSLANKLKDFHGNLLIPIAQTDMEIKEAILLFLNEFKRRRDYGAPCDQKWLIVCDEVNATCEHMVKITDGERELLKEEHGIAIRDKETFVKLKVFFQALAQTCGYESRGFEMFGYFISQKVAGLSWLRNAMMTVFVHGLLMKSEALLAANDDAELAKQVMNFKKGRTLVYGYEFEQPMILQQPKYEIKEVVDADPMTPLPMRSGDRSTSQAVYGLGTDREQAQEAVGTNDVPEKDTSAFELKKLLNEIGRMKANGMSNAEILKHYELHPQGRNNTNLSTLVEIIEDAEGL